MCVLKKKHHPLAKHHSFGGGVGADITDLKLLGNLTLYVNIYKIASLTEKLQVNIQIFF